MVKAGDAFAKIANEAIKRAFAQELESQLEEYANALVNYAVDHRTFQSFTGNTLSSYGCGVYVYGQLVYTVVSIESLSSPICTKIPYGRSVYLRIPDEGYARAVVGSVPVSDEYGYETTIKLLRDWNAPKNSPVSLFMTTGTEYSTYLENVRDLDVLSNTFEEAIATLEQNIKPIIK